MSKFDALSSGTERFLDWKKTNNPTAFFKTAECHQKQKESPTVVRQGYCSVM